MPEDVDAVGSGMDSFFDASIVAGIGSASDASAAFWIN
jgi:hypothetical protein